MRLIDRLVGLSSRVRPGGVILNLHTFGPEATRRLVERLDPHFDFVHHDDLLDRMERPGRRPFCLVTFDDAKRSVRTRTVPVLDAMGVPAAVYVVTEHADRPMALWFDRWETLCRELPRVPCGCDIHTLKSLPLDVLQERVDRLCRTYGLDADGSDEVTPMDWEDVRELDARGHTIGAHSTRHAILVNEPVEAACQDIARSMAQIATALGRPCRTFAFPNGNYTARLADEAVRCGARTVMTTEPLWVGGAAQPWRLPRVQLHDGASAGRSALKLLLSRLGCVLVNPDGTGRQYVAVERLARRRPPAAAAVDEVVRAPTPARSRVA